ncbi:MAG: Nicotinamide-nucleotide amidohydrolase PncC [Chlamydiia bacterium]|nr:Nicotinamide-nucleotide amidohydrolase PncC [Chlamydiia bacterium]
MKHLQQLFIEKNWTLSLAESCTGGLIASTLTKLPGSSAYFLGSFVTYCDTMKVDVLGVSDALIKEKTAVSLDVCKQMCMGALKRAKSDFAIAVTGDAGPGGAQVGEVFGAIGNKDSLFVGKIPKLLGLKREEVQQKVTDFLLNALYHFVKNNEVPFVKQ